MCIAFETVNQSHCQQLLIRFPPTFVACIASISSWPGAYKGVLLSTPPEGGLLKQPNQANRQPCSLHHALRFCNATRWPIIPIPNHLHLPVTHVPYENKAFACQYTVHLLNTVSVTHTLGLYQNDQSAQALLLPQDSQASAGKQPCHVLIPVAPLPCDRHGICCDILHMN